MPEEEVIHLIALTCVPNIGDIHARTLLRHFGNARTIFRAKRHELEKINGIGSVRANAIRSFRNFHRAEQEYRFVLKSAIKVLTEGNPAYPRRMLHCPDAPYLMYLDGDGPLNQDRMISIVGTRMPTAYGRDWLVEFMKEIAPFKPVIISGLAYGIDTLAHRLSLTYDLPTFGVLAHGLDRVYPQANHQLAKEMRTKGGLLTEFRSGTPPDPQNFPRRNRIVASLSDAVIVVETGKKGGSMITADLANSYHKDVMALPGRVHDTKSQGCNQLIHDHRAHLITSAEDVVQLLNWDIQPGKERIFQMPLFHELSELEKKILEISNTEDGIHVDELSRQTGMTPGKSATVILDLEMAGLLEAMPGKRIRAILPGK